ncbi:hypothetical protein SDJN03_10859, partial [Cucurbita argyrosperma subsp. sororia]
MNFRKLGVVLMILVVAVAFLSNSPAVDAARIVPGDFASANHLEMYPSAYEHAKNTVSCWLGRLSSGPSPKGFHHNGGIRAENGNRPISVCERRCVGKCFAHIRHYHFHFPLNTIGVLAYSNLPISQRSLT